jgi:hypothetical protein
LTGRLLLEWGDSNPTFSWLLRVSEGLDIELGELVERFEQMQMQRSDPGD